MKVYQATETEIDGRLLGDKRRDSGAFCRGYDAGEEPPSGFFALQDKIRDGLEKLLWENFDDGIDRANLPAWKTAASHTWFYFPCELIASERIVIEISDEILGDKLIALMWSYLEKCEAGYCVVVAVYKGMERGSEYLGRFVETHEEIAVEKSLSETWVRQMTLMEFKIGA